MSSNKGIRPLTKKIEPKSARKGDWWFKISLPVKVSLGFTVLSVLFGCSVLVGAGLGSLASRGLGIVGSEALASSPAADAMSEAENETFGKGGPLEPPTGEAVLDDQGEVHEDEDLKQFNYTINKNDNLFTALQCFGVPRTTILSWVDLAKDKYDLGRLKPGQTMILYADSDHEFVRFELNVSRSERLVISKEDEGYLAAIESFEADDDSLPESVNNQPHPQWVDPVSGHQFYRGTVESTFYEAALKAGMTPARIMSLTKAMSGVSFDRDLKPGSHFSVVVGPMEADGREGPVLAAMVEVQGSPHYVFRFRDRGRDHYYSEKGVSRVSARLICPVRYRRISSGYTKRRFHPVLGIYRPHLGVDYAAPTGTPVKAAADGIIESAGRAGDYGNSIVVRHQGDCKTRYSHLSRFARGIKSGVHVRQGQVIGYVGATGLATGPHLDYRVYIHGNAVNPLRVTGLPSQPVSDRAGFNSLKDQMIQELEEPLPMGPPVPLAANDGAVADSDD